MALNMLDYVKTHFKVAKLANLPFATQLVPLAVFFAVPGNQEASYTDAQRDKINQWFWRSCMSRRYSSGVIRNLNADIQEMVKLRSGEDSSLGHFDVSFDNNFFLFNTFGITSVNTKTFILILAQQNPMSFISGAPVDLYEKLKDANRTEFHHLMPRKFVKDSEQEDAFVSVLANFAFLSRADNREIGGEAPSKYKSKMQGDVARTLRRGLIPIALFDDKLLEFLEARAQELSAEAARLCSLTAPSTAASTH